MSLEKIVVMFQFYAMCFRSYLISH